MLLGRRGFGVVSMGNESLWIHFGLRKKQVFVKEDPLKNLQNEWMAQMIQHFRGSLL